MNISVTIGDRKIRLGAKYAQKYADLRRETMFLFHRKENTKLGSVTSYPDMPMQC